MRLTDAPGSILLLPRRDWGDECADVEFDWPPCLSYEEQQCIVYGEAQQWIRFSNYGGFSRLPSLNLVPRITRQRLYREAAA